MKPSTVLAVLLPASLPGGAFAQNYSASRAAVSAESSASGAAGIVHIVPPALGALTPLSAPAPSITPSLAAPPGALVPRIVSPIAAAPAAPAFALRSVGSPAAKPDTPESKGRTERLSAMFDGGANGEDIFQHLQGGETIGSSAPKITPIFGAEFTFTNKELLRADYGKNGLKPYNKANGAARDRMKNILQERCRLRGDCRVLPGRDRDGIRNYRVAYKDGWWFQISVDPGVVEIQTKPSTRGELERLRRWIQKDIFGAARQAGLQSNGNVGQGHIHIDARSAFGNDARLLRDFFVDFQNHPALWSETLGQTANVRGNAPTLNLFPKRQRRAYYRVIYDFDRGRMTGLKDLARQIQKRVYTKALEDSLRPAAKYQALNLTRIVRRTREPNFPTGAATLEIRALRSQRNTSEFLRLIKLFEARLEYLKRRADVPVYDLGSVDWAGEGEVRDLYNYVVESGLDWKEYRPLLNWHLKDYKPKEYMKPRQRGKLAQPRFSLKRAGG